ncbi:hypothetical protein CEUSTIGMA_g10600.t1 [Chlamydomonas eustigma]|uniref:EF-hand domain-containing protein n=1 Tax=Chlamydomonas eustigma TaxID=1157962 RepID=A0A250XJC4_9CHLO|nr:hypothetical protein CEUSTIGMA_g10600.t1 [Chlamydomonas eustigma]|eukprot:GAX83174.1 hypothetical protein CEUSTIGMA_g10600.t1 [Chlamydomonas eustigma]
MMNIHQIRVQRTHTRSLCQTTISNKNTRNQSNTLHLYSSYSKLFGSKNDEHGRARPSERLVMRSHGGSAGGGGSEGGGNGGDGSGGGQGGAGGSAFVPIYLQGVIESLQEAEKAWEKYDTEGRGTLHMKEATAMLLRSEGLEFMLLRLEGLEFMLLRSEGLEFMQLRLEGLEFILLSKEMQAAARMATGVHLPPPSKKDLHELLLAADKDHDGNLSKILAEAVVGIADTDKNGKVDGRELKNVLSLVGVPPMLLIAIPDKAGVNYHSFFKMIDSKL